MINQLYKPFKHWDKPCSTIWIYSDPHFGDWDMAHIYPQDDEQIKLINSKVGRNDTLIILGDVGDPECVKQLRGYKILICGNHDLGASNYEDIFDEVYIGPLIISDKIILSHEPLEISWMFNIHGHTHGQRRDKYGHLCACANCINFLPINLNQFVKSGRLKEMESIHRITINVATKRRKNGTNKRTK